MSSSGSRPKQKQPKKQLQDGEEEDIKEVPKDKVKNKKKTKSKPKSKGKSKTKAALAPESVESVESVVADPRPKEQKEKKSLPKSGRSTKQRKNEHETKSQQPTSPEPEEPAVSKPELVPSKTKITRLGKSEVSEKMQAGASGIEGKSRSPSSSSSPSSLPRPLSSGLAHSISATSSSSSSSSSSSPSPLAISSKESGSTVTPPFHDGKKAEPLTEEETEKAKQMKERLIKLWNLHFGKLCDAFHHAGGGYIQEQETSIKEQVLDKFGDKKEDKAKEKKDGETKRKERKEEREKEEELEFMEELGPILEKLGDLMQGICELKEDLRENPLNSEYLVLWNKDFLSHPLWKSFDSTSPERNLGLIQTLIEDAQAGKFGFFKALDWTLFWSVLSHPDLQTLIQKMQPLWQLGYFYSQFSDNLKDQALFRKLFQYNDIFTAWETAQQQPLNREGWSQVPEKVVSQFLEKGFKDKKDFENFTKDLGGVSFSQIQDIVKALGGPFQSLQPGMKAAIDNMMARQQKQIGGKLDLSQASMASLLPQGPQLTEQDADRFRTWLQSVSKSMNATVKDPSLAPKFAMDVLGSLNELITGGEAATSLPSLPFATPPTQIASGASRPLSSSTSIAAPSTNPTPTTSVSSSSTAPRPLSASASVQQRMTPPASSDFDKFRASVGLGLGGDSYLDTLD